MAHRHGERHPERRHAPCFRRGHGAWERRSPSMLARLSRDSRVEPATRIVKPWVAGMHGRSSHNRASARRCAAGSRRQRLSTQTQHACYTEHTARPWSLARAGRHASPHRAAPHHNNPVHEGAGSGEQQDRRRPDVRDARSPPRQSSRAKKPRATWGSTCLRSTPVDDDDTSLEAVLRSRREPLCPPPRA